MSIEVGKTYDTSFSYYYDGKLIKNDVVKVVSEGKAYISLRSEKCEREYGMSPSYFSQLIKK